MKTQIYTKVLTMKLSSPYFKERWFAIWRSGVVNFLILSILLFISNLSFSQPLEIYDWQAPKYDIAPEDTMKRGVILLDYRSIHFNKIKAPYVKISKKQRLIHRRIFINTDSLIDRFSRLTIPVVDQENISHLKVRVIRSKQVLEEISRDDLVLIDTLEEFEDQTVYHIKGVEKGNIVEYLYTIEMNPYAYGTEIFQSIIPTRKAELQLFGNGISFKVKGYNGAKVRPITEKVKRNIYGGVMQNIPAFQDEYYAANDANKARIDYIASDMNWRKLSEVVALNILYTKNKTQKKISKILDNEVKLFNYEIKSDKIQAIENYIKEEYSIVHENNLSDVKKILDSKQTNVTGLTYLFAAFLKAANIEYEVVASCDRFGRLFDSDFSTPLNLDYFLFYFLDEKKFLTPYPIEFEYGTIPDFLMGQQGFSVKGSFSKSKGVSASHRFLNIDNQAGFETSIIENINVHFNKGEEPFIALTKELSGYRAIDFVKGYNESEISDRVKYINSFMPYASDSSDVNKILLNGSNDFSDQLYSSDIVIYAELPAQPFMEVLDKQTFSLKIGKLIGEQMELKDTSRFQDLELNYQIVYDRNFILHYDESYTISDPEKLYVDLDLNTKTKNQMNFSSTIHSSPNKLEIKILEHYQFLQLDKSNYPTFRKVINAASEFNKQELLISINP